MLGNYAKILIDVLSGEREDDTKSWDNILWCLQIDPELKAIIYECLHAIDKINERDEISYEDEINKFITKEKV